MINKTPHRKKKFVPNAFKFMVAVGSLAGTVGIWNILANNDLLQASAQNTDPTSTVIVKQPLPTLVPLTTVNSAILPTTTAQTSSPLRDVTISSQTQSSSASLMPTTNSTMNSAPAPVTVTQTSKKP